jgi:23S rRNA (pseudouridine1915-N3)-methyltransferase
MRITILAVTGKQPAWLVTAIEDYARRLRSRAKVELIDLKAEPRSSGKTVEAILKAEAERLNSRLPPTSRCIALDERGRSRSTHDLARDIATWQQAGEHVVFLIGGPDGLAEGLKRRAEAQWSLSPLTLPHGLAKLILVEQLYRACTLLEGHPYHRE